MQLANGNVEEAISLADDFLTEVQKENKDLTSFSTEELLNLGTTYNEAEEYAKAIDFLSASIAKDPSNKEAYFQRAVSYLETGHFEEAVSDYLTSEKQVKVPSIVHKASNEFRTALLNGLVGGSKEAAINFLPSLFSFAYTAVAHPIDSLINFVDACNELRLVTQDYLKEVDWSAVEENTLELPRALIEPGLKKIYEQMEQLSPEEQGHLIGHTIGSFGVDFLAGAGIIKGFSNSAKLANACKAVREAGRVYELEVLAQSGAQAEAIASTALERAALKESLLNKAKSGQVVIKSPNAQFHIMQEKHAWDKVITVTGNVEEDFKQVVTFLEKNNILDPKNYRATSEFPLNGSVKNIHILEYKIVIEAQEIEVFFEKYLETGELFLKNAWVKTR